MKKKYYSVSELANILDLHTKTVARFIREGKISAKKIGRAWRVSEDALKAYAHAELAEEKTKGRDFDASGPVRISVSAVIEIKEQDQEEASRISNSLMAMLNSKDESFGQTRYDFFYHPESGVARHVLYGSPAFIQMIMEMFSMISRPSEKRE